MLQRECRESDALKALQVGSSVIHVAGQNDLSGYQHCNRCTRVITIPGGLPWAIGLQITETRTRINGQIVTKWEILSTNELQGS